MKKLVIIFTVLISMSLKTHAQIPNNGFEIWESYPDPANPNNIYQKPDQWMGLLPNSSSTYSFSIEKNMYSYPEGTGQYSMIIKPDTENDVDGAAFSYDSFPSGDSSQNIPPAFPINYRPTSLFLYYKYLPADGDSMRIICNFYKNRAVIGGFDYKSPQIVPSWTKLETPISFYTSDIPDSVTIILTTFYNTQHNGSRLYVDNLSFDPPITSVNESISGDLPNSFALMQNYPNPFNPETEIKYDLPQPGNVNISVFNAQGQKVKVLINGHQHAGSHTMQWDGKDEKGSPVTSGIYIFRLQAVGNRKSIKALLIE